jgi:hypothetical protein
MTDEQIAALLYPGQSPTPRKPTPQTAQVEKTVETPAEPLPAPPAVTRDLASQDDRLLQFLEDDIERLESEALADENMIRRNMARED